MTRPPIDLEAIDRELAQLGTPRADLAALIARYVVRGDESGQTTQPKPVPDIGKRASDTREAGDRFELAAPARRVEPPAWSGQPVSHVLGSQDLNDDHDEFELLVDDDEIDRIDDDQFETA